MSSSPIGTRARRGKRSPFEGGDRPFHARPPATVSRPRLFPCGLQAEQRLCEILGLDRSACSLKQSTWVLWNRLKLKSADARDDDAGRFGGRRACGQAKGMRLSNSTRSRSQQYRVCGGIEATYSCYHYAGRTPVGSAQTNESPQLRKQPTDEMRPCRNEKSPHPKPRKSGLCLMFPRDVALVCCPSWAAAINLQN